MPFLTLSNADVSFSERKLTWKSYTAAKALPTTKQMELIDKKGFAKAALDENVEAFVVHVTSLSLREPTMTIRLARQARIALLLTEEHAIELQEGQQPPYGPIYSLGPVELKTLKTYIETNQANGFIWPSSHPPVPPSSLSGSQTVASAYAWIIGA